MPSGFAHQVLESHNGQVEKLQGTRDTLEKHVFGIFLTLVIRPAYAADLGHSRKAIIQFRHIAVGLPRIIPRPVNAEPATAGRVLSRGVDLVVSTRRIL